MRRRLKKTETPRVHFTLLLVLPRALQGLIDVLTDVRYPTDPWPRSRPPTRPYLSWVPISVQPRDAMATANPCYRRGLAVASGRAHRCIMGGQSVLVARWSVVRDLNPGRRSTGGRRRRKAGAPSRTAACCPPATGNKNGARGVTGFFDIMRRRRLKKTETPRVHFTLLLVLPRAGSDVLTDVRYSTDPWLRSRPPTKPYLSQGPISV